MLLEMLLPREQLTLLGGELRETAVNGVYEGAVNRLALRVVETTVAWPAPGEHLLYSISPAYLKRPSTSPQ